MLAGWWLGSSRPRGLTWKHPTLIAGSLGWKAVPYGSMLVAEAEDRRRTVRGREPFGRATASTVSINQEVVPSEVGHGTSSIIPSARRSMA